MIGGSRVAEVKDRAVREVQAGVSDTRSSTKYLLRKRVAQTSPLSARGDERWW